MSDSISPKNGMPNGSYWHANASNDAFFIHDLKAGVLVDVNRRAEEMYGYSWENFIGTGIGRISSGGKLGV